MKTYLNFFATLIIMLLVAGQAMAKVPPQGRQTLYKAQMLMDKELYSQAATLISQYVKATDESIHPQIFITLGGVYHLAGAKKEALTIFQKGYEANPDNEYLCMNTGIALYELEQFADAGIYLEKTFDLQEKSKPEILYQAGSAYYQGEDYSASAKVLTRLLDLEKSPRKEWIRLAVHALMEAKQIKRAEKMLLRYLAVNPNEAAYWELLAKLHLDRESYSKAASALEICYRLENPEKRNLEQLASLYRFLNAPLMAASTLHRAYGARPTPEEALKIAALTASAGRTQQAISYLEKNSKTPSGTLQRGMMLYHSRQFPKAKKLLEQCLTGPSKSKARFYLALCAWERRDWKTAETHLSKLSGSKEFKQRAAGSLAVLEDLDASRLESLL